MSSAAGTAEAEDDRTVPLMRLLAAGVGLDDALGRLWGTAPDDAAPQEARVLLEQALHEVRAEDLRPAVAAALAQRLGIELTPRSVSDLRSAAAEVLVGYLNVGARDTMPVDSRPALTYALFAVRQREVLLRLKAVRPEEAPLQAALSHSTKARIEEFLLARNVKGSFVTLDGLAQWWKATVDWVESDRAPLHEEYVDRLTRRDSLGEAVALVPPSEEEPIRSDVAELDRRFERATQPVPASVRPRPERAQAWWWYRVPRAPSLDFLARLDRVSPAAAEALPGAL